MARNHMAAFHDTIHKLRKNLEQLALDGERALKITYIIDAEFMLPEVRDAMADCGWTVEVEHTEMIMDPWGPIGPHGLIERHYDRARRRGSH